MPARSEPYRRDVFLFGCPVLTALVQDERGIDVRESTRQRSAKVAEDILAKRKTEVAMRLHFSTCAFDAMTFADLADYWWQAHGSKTRSQFGYLYPWTIFRAPDFSSLPAQQSAWRNLVKNCRHFVRASE